MIKAINRNKRNTIILIAVFILFFVILASPFVVLGFYSLQNGQTETYKVTQTDRYGYQSSHYVTQTVDGGNTAMTFFGIAAFLIIFAVVYALIQYFKASKMALSVTGAQKVTLQSVGNNPILVNYIHTVHSLSIGEGFDKDPEIYIINDPSPNAFATGRDPEHSAVCATTGLLQVMNERELRAVLGHEVSHIKNYDIRVSMIVFGLVSALAFISEISYWAGIMTSNNNRRDNNGNALSAIFLIIGLVGMILLVPAAGLVQLAVSRQREYMADQSSAELTKDTDGMISALNKLRSPSLPTHMIKTNRATAAMFFNNPMGKRMKFTDSLFQTHPSLENRIKRLLQTKDTAFDYNKVTDEQLNQILEAKLS